MSKETLKVFFDGECPLCRKEINFYKKISQDSQISWINIEGASFDAGTTGLSKDKLKARFHVMLNDEVYTGGYAFLQLWSFIPGFAWATKVLDKAFFPKLLDIVYDFFLIIRPTLQKILIKIERK
jgi:predicted DCC family thiol-disulfide oxidoreductase YuxK